METWHGWRLAFNVLKPRAHWHDRERDGTRVVGKVADVSPGAFPLKRCKAFKQRYFRAIEGPRIPSRLRMTRSFFPPGTKTKTNDRAPRLTKNSNWNHVALPCHDQAAFSLSFLFLLSTFLSLSLFSYTSFFFNFLWTGPTGLPPCTIKHSYGILRSHRNWIPGEFERIWLEHTDKEGTQNIYNVTWIDFVTW